MQVGLIENALLSAPVLLETTLPQNPKPGQFLFYQKRVFFCIDVAQDGTNYPTWVPLTNEINIEQFTQSVSAMDWVIQHDMNARPIVQVFDSNGQVIVPTNIDSSDLNKTIISLPYATIGMAVLVGGSVFGSLPALPQSYDGTFTNTADQTFVHGLGYNPLVQVIVNGQAYEPASVSFPNVNSVRITFDSPQSGAVRFV